MQTGRYRYIQGYRDTYRGTQIHTEVYRYIHGDTDIFRWIQIQGDTDTYKGI